jgi:soluble lytic murein transglycosylase-like protein
MCIRDSDIAMAVARSSRQHQVRPELMIGLIRQESEFNPKSHSSTNDYGLCQMHNRPIWDVQDNIEASAAELEEWRTSYKLFTSDKNAATPGRIKPQTVEQERGTLAHYNGGCRPPRISWTYAEKVLSYAGK